MGKDVEWFIETVLLGEIKEINQKHHYLSFLLIAAGIEFLGACLDNKDFNKNVRNGVRFKKAIKELFPSEYQSHADLLYKSFRCGFAHTVRPAAGIGLTHRKESVEFGTEHLTKNNGNVILIAEDFFEDFEKGCQEVIKRIKEGKITNKVKQDFLNIPSDATTSHSTSGCGS